ncbi:hypothetical protein [Nonomuraea sp. NPDC023979]|uniref:hypothetical protein n=1 Tax=Nonomuraea sp. NPDC023979 TaxID=3154796 RepID=UPI003411B6BA
MTHELLERMTEVAHVNPACEPVSDDIAAKHDKALGALRDLLTERGVHSHIVEWLKLTLKSSPWPQPPVSLENRYAPELLVFAPQGWRVATVRIAPRSGAYIVEVAQVGNDNAVLPDKVTPVPGHLPAKAAALIPGYLPDMP